MTWYVADEHFEADGKHINNEFVVKGDFEDIKLVEMGSNPFHAINRTSL